MIPVLYESIENSFSSNGLGGLPDAVRCLVTEVYNSTYELEMEYPISGLHFSDIVKNRIILAKTADGKQTQPFRIYKISKPLNGICTIYAQHISYDLEGIPVAPNDQIETVSGAANALALLKNRSLITNGFEVWTNISNGDTSFSLDTPRSFRQYLGGVSGSILDRFGGDYEFDRSIVRLWSDRGHDSGVIVAYGKNITGLKYEESIESTYTGVIAYYMDSEGGWVRSDIQYAENHASFDRERIYILDRSASYEEMPTAERLNSDAKNYIKTNGFGKPKVSLDVSFVPLRNTEEYAEIAPLENVNMCDTVTVKYAQLGVSVKAKVIKTVYNVLLERYDSIQLGDARSNMNAVVSSISEDIVKPVENRLTKTIAYQTDLIRGGKGGYIVIVQDAEGHPRELLALDAPSLEKATHVLRINTNGIGFGESYEGPFETAWTLDGTFNANFIKTGVLDANLITAGTIRDKKGSNYWNLDTGEIKISSQAKVDNTTLGGKFTALETTIQTTAEGITTAASQTYETKTDANTKVTNLQTLVQQTAEGITSSVSQTYETKTDATSKLTTARSEIKQLADSLSLSVESVSGKASIVLKANGDTGTNNHGLVDISGMVTFSDLDGNQTIINGATIKTGTVQVNRITGTLGDKDASYIDFAKGELQVATANITGKLTASQIDATNLHVNAANIDGTLTIGDVSGLQSVLDGKLTASDVGAYGSTTISGNRITTGTISADRIDANNLKVKAANITGTITADAVKANTTITSPRLEYGSSSIDLGDGGMLISGPVYFYSEGYNFVTMIQDKTRIISSSGTYKYMYPFYRHYSSSNGDHIISRHTSLTGYTNEGILFYAFGDNNM